MLEIIGTKKDKETAKAIRYMKERRVPFSFIDLGERKELPEKIWKSIFASADDASDLIDTSSRFFRDNGYQWREYSPEAELREHPELLKLPVLRAGQKAHAGFSEVFIKEVL